MQVGGGGGMVGGGEKRTGRVDGRADEKDG